MSKRQYFYVNIAKFITEIIGTASIGVFYLIMGDHQVGVFLGYWIVTIFGSRISGSHFNPAITLVQMFRSGSACLETKMLGLIYICGQIIGSIIAGFLGIFLLEPHDNNTDFKTTIEPIGEKKHSIAIISEMFGTAIFVSNFMIHSDKSTRYSDDKSINSMIIASSYVAARLMCGGNFVTGIPQYGLHSHFD